jgi:methylated-DNA-[protein]-cysteine S-methyltransferase
MADNLILSIDRLSTPIGELLIVVDRDGKLRVADWTDHEDRMLLLLRRHYGEGGYTMKAARNPGGLTSAMRAYFEGDLGVLDRLSVATAGTPFQRDVWRALREIKCGTTISYAELARRIDRPSAVRAAGLANGQNPISIVVPCHRVIGSNGSLTGYGGGIERKRWLLRHEGVASRPSGGKLVSKDVHAADNRRNCE